MPPSPPGGGGQLLEGVPFDEATQRAEFAAAVSAWRTGSGPPAMASDEIQTSAVESPTERLEITFSSTSDLSYLERIMLKRHQQQLQRHAVPTARATSQAYQQEAEAEKQPSPEPGADADAATTIQAAFRGHLARQEAGRRRRALEELKNEEQRAQTSALVAMATSALQSQPIGMRRKCAPLPVAGQSRRIQELSRPLEEENVVRAAHPLAISLSMMDDFETMEQQVADES